MSGGDKFWVGEGDGVMEIWCIEEEIGGWIGEIKEGIGGEWVWCGDGRGDIEFIIIRYRKKRE